MHANTIISMTSIVHSPPTISTVATVPALVRLCIGEAGTSACRKLCDTSMVDSLMGA